jgi:hypothetical protein
MSELLILNLKIFFLKLYILFIKIIVPTTWEGLSIRALIVFFIVWKIIKIKDKRKKKYKKEKSKKKFKKRDKEKKYYGILKFKYNYRLKISKITQERAIRNYNKYIRNFVRKHKRNPNRYELGRIVRGSSHETISYRKGKSGHWKRQWVRQYLYGLHGINYTKR